MSEALAYAESLLEQRLLSESLIRFDQAERQGADPDRCAAGRWMISALQGNLAAAWAESDAIRRRNGPDPNRFWQGEDPCGRQVIVRCLHGFGDSVQLLRLAPRLRSVCSRLIVECAPRAVDLLRCLPGIDEVIPWGDAAPNPRPSWDVQLELMELPYLLRISLADLPTSTDHLKLPPPELRRASRAIGSCNTSRAVPNVGIVWSSGDWNPSRSIPFDLLTPILSRKDCQYWNLQGGPIRNQWRRLSHPGLRDTPLLAHCGLVPLAAIISQLDLVITVDTLAAHLAGALNIPCLLLLQYAADWRWMVHRNDSPWYPSLRLFRQTVHGDWAGLLHNVDCALSEWITARARQRVVA
jgi:hypothetical protein